MLEAAQETVRSVAEIVETGEQIRLRADADAGVAIRDLDTRVRQLTVRELVSYAGDLTLAIRVMLSSCDETQERLAWSWQWRLAYEDESVALDQPPSADIRWLPPSDETPELPAALLNDGTAARRCPSQHPRRPLKAYVVLASPPHDAPRIVNGPHRKAATALARAREMLQAHLSVNAAGADLSDGALLALVVAPEESPDRWLLENYIPWWAQLDARGEVVHGTPRGVSGPPLLHLHRPARRIAI